VGRIVFLCPFVRTEISGGIKTAYRHAELLAEMGFDASVYQPEGPPGWFETRVKVLRSLTQPTQDDVLVFPEAINGPLVELARARTVAKKVLYCQAQYYALFNAIPPEDYRSLGFARVACQSALAKGFLERVLHFPDVAVIPCFVDPDLFHPRERSMQIAAIPKKLPREAAAIHSVFRLKYPELKSIPWAIIEDRPEREIADIFGRSTIVLSLPFLESFGLVPLEAMASGAIVVGFHGHGALEYATPENGFWFPSDHIEETADALAHVISALQVKDPAILKIRDAGFSTAARYGKNPARDALRAFYGPMLS
jgi:glycosyltransferase involved in cell wall biosynthesis